MTTDLTGCFLGYDPGGNEKHGVAAIRVVSGSVQKAACRTVKTAGDALQWLRERIARKETECLGGAMADLGRVHGLGIDTLTYWSSGRSGLRTADEMLREVFDPVLQKEHRKRQVTGAEKPFRTSVVALNSLYGSMSVNGMFVLRKIRKSSERAGSSSDPWITETHPKVLYFALSGEKYDYDNRREEMNRWLVNEMNMRLDGMEESELTKNDHEWDAVISAWAANQGRTGRWETNLVTYEDSANLDFPAGCVDYRWPGPPKEAKWHKAWTQTVINREPNGKQS